MKKRTKCRLVTIVLTMMLATQSLMGVDVYAAEEAPKTTESETPAAEIPETETPVTPQENPTLDTPVVESSVLGVSREVETVEPVGEVLGVTRTPHTGDESNIQNSFFIAMISFLGIVTIIFLNKRRKNIN